MTDKRKDDPANIEQARRAKAARERFFLEMQEERAKALDTLVGEIIQRGPGCENIVVVFMDEGEASQVAALEDDRKDIIVALTDALVSYTYGTRKLPDD